MNTKLLSYVVKTSLFLPFLWDRFWAFFYKKSMGSCGKNVMLKPATSVFKGIENFYIASDVRIARYAVIYSTVAKVYIGSKVEIAPHLPYIIHSGFISGYQNRYGDNLKPPTNVYHRMTA